MTKRCSRCRRDKPLSEFSANAERPDGLQPTCKACRAAHMRERRAADPQLRETERARRRAYGRATTTLINRHRGEFEKILAAEIAATDTGDVNGSCTAGQTAHAPRAHAGSTTTPRVGAPDGVVLPGPDRDTTPHPGTGRRRI